MAIAGSTTEPTHGAVWYGLNSRNQFASGITLPAGGPWRIYRIGVWMAGQGETARTRLCMWDSSNNLLRQGAEFTAANRSFPAPNGDSVAYESDITDYEIAGGGTVLVGFHTHSDDNRQFPHNSGGTRKEKTVGDSPISMASSTLETGSMGVWLYYELANSVPNAPTIDEPDQNEIVNDTTPLIDWTHSDPDGDAQSGYQVQVDNSSGFGSPAWDSGNVSSSSTSVSVGATLTRGTTYYARVRTRDAEGFGAWSSTRTFKIAALPTASVTSPSADGVAAPLYYTAGSDTTPKFRIGWSFACADGGTQSSAIIRIYNTSDVLQHTHNHSGSSTTADLSAYAPANGTIYRVTVQVTCSHGAQSTETTPSARDMRARWGRASYRADLGSTPTTLSVSSSTTPNSGSVVLEYGSTAGTTPEPTDWKATIAEVTKQRYVWHRVTLLPQAVAAPTSPTLNSVTITYSANVLTPDDWTLSGIALVDLGTFVYGTQSVRHSEDGTNNAHETYQIVPCVAGTDYIFSGRVKTQGDPGAFLQIYTADGSELLASVSATADTDWTRYATPVFNSGGATSLKVRLRTASLDAASIAWFDALKLEASKVVTPWTPGFLGEAVVLDAGGLQVDGVAGGVFRLRSNSGNGTVRLSQGGLHIDSASDASLASTDHPFQIGPTAGANLRVDANEVMAVSNGAVNDLALNAEGGQVTINATSGGAGDGLRVMRGSIRLGTTTNPSSGGPDLAIMFGSDVELYRSAANVLTLESGDTFVGDIDPTNMAVGSVSINPTANTPTGVTVNYTALTGASFAGFATASTTVPGSNVEETSITSVDSNSAVVYIYRTNTTTTTVFWMVWGY